MIYRRRNPGGVAALLLLALLVVAPVVFGSVLPRELLLLELLALAAFGAVLLESRETPALGRARVPALAVAGVGLVGLLQSLPWPRPLVEHLAARNAASWSRAAELAGDPVSGFLPLSLSPPVSREVAYVYLAAAACLVAAAGVAAERRHRRLLGAGLVAVTVFEIVYGAEQWFSQRSAIWGRELAGGDRLRGTFVNPDHFATFLLVPLSASFAASWWAVRRAQRRGSLAERRLLLLTVPWLFFLMFFVALAFTGSRAGFVAAVLALSVQTLALFLHDRKWRSAMTGVVALAVGLGGISYFGYQKSLGRWLETPAYEITWNTRFVVYDHALELFHGAPVLGTGLGTFGQAFPWVQPPELGLTWVHAHSDVLEVLVTTGLVGFALAALAAAAVLRELLKSLRQARRSEDRAMALAALGALAGVLAHSMIDFGLSVPANAFTLATVVGLGCGTRLLPKAPEERAPTRRAHREEEEPLPGGDRERRRKRPARRRGP